MRPGLGAYGFVVFTHRPIAEDIARYRILCDALLATMEPASFFKTSKDNGTKTITYWPVARSRNGVRVEACDELVDRYNYNFVNTRLADLHLSDRRGPVLVAYRSTPGARQTSWLILDMSNFSDSDIERGLRVWKQYLASNAGASFTLANARAAFGDFLRRYGETTVAIVTQ